MIFCFYLIVVLLQFLSNQATMSCCGYCRSSKPFLRPGWPSSPGIRTMFEGPAAGAILGEPRNRGGAKGCPVPSLIFGWQVPEAPRPPQYSRHGQNQADLPGDIREPKNAENDLLGCSSVEFPGYFVPTPASTCLCFMLCSA